MVATFWAFVFAAFFVALYLLRRAGKSGVPLVMGTLTGLLLGAGMQMAGIGLLNAQTGLVIGFVVGLAVACFRKKVARSS